MITVIGTELRRSNARILAVVIALAILLLLVLKPDLTSRWLSYTDYQSSTLFLVVPLALAGGAMLGRREGRAGVSELMTSTGRPRWQKAVPAAVALAVAVAVVHFLFLAFGAVRIGASGGFLSFAGAVPVLADTTILVGAVWVGLAAGRAWSSPVLPPMLAVLTLVAQLSIDFVAGGPDSRLNSLQLSAQPPGADWESVNAQAVLGHLVLGLGLALAGLLMVAGATRLLRIAGLATLIAAVVLTTLVSPTGTTGRFQLDAAAQELVCANGTPQVCVSAAHQDELDEVTPPARRALTLLAKLPDAPTRAVEWRADALSQGDSTQFWGTTPKTEPGTVLFSFRGYSGATSPEGVTANILYGAGTWTNGCKPGADVALGAVGAWLLGTDSLPLGNTGILTDGEAQQGITATVTALRQLPEREQVRRVTAVRDAANACRNDDLLAILTEGPTP
jgi:hypothetical protein